jgi:hypothetical protein
MRSSFDTLSSGPPNHVGWGHHSLDDRKRLESLGGAASVVRRALYTGPIHLEPAH